MVRLNASTVQQLPVLPEDELVSRYKSHIDLLRKSFLSRLELCLGLVGDSNRLMLDIGTGSGVLLPSLSSVCSHVLGLDIHENLHYVSDYLKRIKVENVSLVRADIHHLPFREGIFDGILCVSVLDHSGDPKRAVVEARRIMVEGGALVFGFHVESPLNKTLHFTFTFYSYIRRDLRGFWKHVFEHIHTERELMMSLSEKFSIEEIRYLRMVFPVYLAVKCVFHSS